MPSPETTQARKRAAHKSYVMTKAEAVTSRAW
jgi:hypothetical protein